MPKVPLTPVQQAWVDALRSGNYKQGQAVLRDADGRSCCLGVACEMAVDAGVLSDEHVKTKYSEDAEKTVVFYDRAELYPPSTVVKWLGLRNDRGGWDESARNNHTLAGANDDGKTFAEIADLIEEHADTLFVREASS